MSGSTVGALRHVDDEDREVWIPHEVRRVVSLVPSLSESVALTSPGLLVGATDWCTHPPDLDDRGVVRVRGTKNPDVERIVSLAPDLVLANAEENRRVDLDLLRTAGLAVYVTDIRTLDGERDGAFGSLERMLLACGLPRPDWLGSAAAGFGAVRPIEPRRRAVIPIWRRPWMAVGSDTFTGALLAWFGIDNVLADATERYPRFEPADLPADVDLVVLPDEPYAFSRDDGPEAFAGLETVLVPGRLLTWYGPSLREASADLPRHLSPPRPS